jgi:hypothetical protein
VLVGPRGIEPRTRGLKDHLCSPGADLRKHAYRGCATSGILACRSGSQEGSKVGHAGQPVDRLATSLVSRNRSTGTVKDYLLSGQKLIDWLTIT